MSDKTDCLVKKEMKREVRLRLLSLACETRRELTEIKNTVAVLERSLNSENWDSIKRKISLFQKEKGILEKEEQEFLKVLKSMR
jgi:hypothetical protein